MRIMDTKYFSNISANWITRNKHLLEWSQHRQHCMYTRQIRHNEYLIYAQVKTNENGENIGPKFIVQTIMQCEHFHKNRFWSLNYTSDSIKNALGTREIAIWMFISIDRC